MDQNNLNDFDPTDTYDHYDAIFQPDYDRYMRDYESYQHYVGLCEQEAGGSSNGPKRMRTYIYREREEAEQRLIDHYFGDDEYEPKYPEEKFRRRYFRVRIDAIGRNSIGPILKCTSAIRQMAYDTSPDAFDEYLQIAERTSRECLDHFTKDEKTLKFKRVQEAARKDIERAFGVLQDEGFEVNLRDVFKNPAPNIVRDWVERCDLHVRKTKELRDRKTHIDLRQDLMEHLWNNDDE
ncbi:hypothetical protein Tco_1571417 [Tanacetum coccineum]